METPVRIRQAEKPDVNGIVRLLANDPLGSKRERFESPLPQSYYRAFDTIDQDPNNELVVAVLDDQLVGVLQLTRIPYLTYQGGWRAQIEGVRVARQFRSRGIGRQLFLWAINRARQHRCHLVQLTTDKAPPEALHFYESLGFKPSHEGMKLHLAS